MWTSRNFFLALVMVFGKGQNILTFDLSYEGLLITDYLGKVWQKRNKKQRQEDSLKGDLWWPVIWVVYLTSKHVLSLFPSLSYPS